jgi:formate-dependent nitrite reductase cytochrome c552 subunit
MTGRRWVWVLGAGALCAAVVTSCGEDEPRELRPAPTGSHQVVINQPAKLTSVESGERDSLGRPTRVACATCHSRIDTGPLARRPEELRKFHRGLSFSHGELPCASCHVAGPEVHGKLHLANGELVAMTDVVRLCAQCHGPQHRDYRHGSHGGMNGHWDLRRGGRVRNSCVDCHDPHAPQIPAVRPAPPPRDRFLTPREAHGDAVPAAAGHEQRKGAP